MDETSLVTIFNSIVPSIPSVISAISASIITAMFLRHNTAVTEFEKIKAGRFNEALEDLLKSRKMTYTELYKANNFLAIAKKADDISVTNTGVIDAKQYDFDWFIRFYEATGCISDEEVQQLWAKLLSNEVNSPGHYSLKTIDVLRNLRKQDAELFAAFCAHVISLGDKVFLPNYDKYMEKHGITYTDVMHLSEQDLIYSDGQISLSKEISKDTPLQIFDNHYILIVGINEVHPRKYHLNQFPLTRAGREISQLIDKNEKNRNLVDLGVCLREEARSEKYDISVHEIISIEGEKIIYNTNNMLQTSDLAGRADA